MASNEIQDLMERLQTSLYRTAVAPQAGQTFRSKLPFTNPYLCTARDGRCWLTRRMAIKSSNFSSCTCQEADATAHLARMPVSLVFLASPAPARKKAFHQVGAISREYLKQKPARCLPHPKHKLNKTSFRHSSLIHLRPSAPDESGPRRLVGACRLLLNG